jgi:uncharacterized protein YkwD
MTTRRGLLGTLLGGVAGLSGCVSNPLSGGSEATPETTAAPTRTTQTPTPTPTPTFTTATPSPTPVGAFAPSEFPPTVRERLDAKRGAFGIDALVPSEKLQTVAERAAKRRGRGGSLDSIEEELKGLGCNNGDALVATAPRNDTVANPTGSGTITIDSVDAASKYVVNKWSVPGEKRHLIVDTEITHVGVGSYVTEQNVFVSAVLC